MRISNLETLDKRYDIVYADPPWIQKKGGKKKVRPNSSGGELDYPTLPINEIEKILGEVKTNNKHNFFIWTIEKYLLKTEEMMKSMGYKVHESSLLCVFVGCIRRERRKNQEGVG